MSDMIRGTFISRLSGKHLTEDDRKRIQKITGLTLPKVDETLHKIDFAIDRKKKEISFDLEANLHEEGFQVERYEFSKEALNKLKNSRI